VLKPIIISNATVVRQNATLEGQKPIAEIPLQYELLESLAQGIAIFNKGKCHLSSQTSYYCASQPLS